MSPNHASNIFNVAGARTRTWTPVVLNRLNTAQATGSDWMVRYSACVYQFHHPGHTAVFLYSFKSFYEEFSISFLSA